MKLKRIMKAQSPKKKEKKKEIIIIIIIKKKRRGSQSGQRTCSKDLGQRIYSKKSIKALGP